MNKTTIRVRFAPSPSGFMHLGNVRSALINYIFARQKQGTFILRVEDTDQQRNTDPEAVHIIKDLAWLDLSYDEGPHKEGLYGPYYQSQRTDLYEKYLAVCQDKELVYRCFCTPEELEIKRQRQLALKQPPHYDRACLKLTEQEIQQRLVAHDGFIWRFKLDYSKTVSFYDLAHKMMKFELKHFSDIPLTRRDGSFTFLFANFIDDREMKITHVFRGEDHLTNTAAQVALYEAFSTEVPVFWHLPVLGNAEGKKLSKRDFGFSLNDLRDGGYLPEAITNYLAIIGHSVKTEIMDMKTIIESFDFQHISPTGQIRYDVEKLRWTNHEWIMHYNTTDLALLCRPFITAEFPSWATIEQEKLTALIAPLQQELITLKESANLLAFVVSRPEINPALLDTYHIQTHRAFLMLALPALACEAQPEEAVKTLQALCKEQKAPLKDIFCLIRIALTGKPQGPSIKDLLSMLSHNEVQARLAQLLD